MRPPDPDDDDDSAAAGADDANTFLPQGLQCNAMTWQILDPSCKMQTAHLQYCHITPFAEYVHVLGGLKLPMVNINIYKVPFRQTMHKTPQARCLNRGNELAKIGKIALIDLLSHFFTLCRKGIRQKLSSTGNDLPHSSLLPALPSCQDARPRVQSICWFISVKV